MHGSALRLLGVVGLVVGVRLLVELVEGGLECRLRPVRREVDPARLEDLVAGQRVEYGATRRLGTAELGALLDEGLRVRVLLDHLQRDLALQAALGQLDDPGVLGGQLSLPLTALELALLVGQTLVLDLLTAPLLQLGEVVARAVRDRCRACH